MTLELVRDLIRVDQVIGEEMTQAVVEGDVVVPDSKPDVDRILSINGWVVITDKEIVEDKVIVEGVVNVKSLYISQEGEQPAPWRAASVCPDRPARRKQPDGAEIGRYKHQTHGCARKLNGKCVLPHQQVMKVPKT